MLIEHDNIGIAFRISMKDFGFKEKYVEQIEQACQNTTIWSSWLVLNTENKHLCISWILYNGENDKIVKAILCDNITEMKNYIVSTGIELEKPVIYKTIAEFDHIIESALVQHGRFLLKNNHVSVN